MQLQLEQRLVIILPVAAVGLFRSAVILSASDLKNKKKTYQNYVKSVPTFSGPHIFFPIQLQ